MAVACGGKGAVGVVGRAGLGLDSVILPISFNWTSLRASSLVKIPRGPVAVPWLASSACFSRILRAAGLKRNCSFPGVCSFLTGVEICGCGEGEEALMVLKLVTEDLRLWEFQHVSNLLLLQLATQ